ncbi:hypothetical protein ONZ45_g13251 [Pleurotus djamor]|nr:hypothetical protein ONZ45_g13251 [Pleurotus djamor]
MEITTVSEPLPSCKANLMPFHLDYDGPAPLSTYFQIKSAKSTVGAPDPSASADGSVPGEPQKDETKHEDSQNTDTMISESINDLQLKDALDDDGSIRYTSTFRGRVVHGLDVPLPEGYVGVVLQSEEPDRSTSKNDTKKGKGKAREVVREDSVRTRRSSRRKDKAEEDDEEEEEEEHSASRPMDTEARPTKTFTPVSSFSSFTLWHPDNPVDERGDEYYRSLMEWTKLTSIIHQTE